MKVKIQGYLEANHSWSVTNRAIGQELLNQGHDVDFIATDEPDKAKHFPENLKPYLKTKPDDNYDCCISYTAPLNWQRYLRQSKKNRFGIWCYEFYPNLPDGFAKHHIHTDYILAPSVFARDVFVMSKVPEEKVIVVPHGINIKDKTSEIYPLNTKKKIKILVNIGQPHPRKYIDGIFNAYGRAFNKQDDVCLIAKISAPDKNARVTQVNIQQLYNDFCKTYPNHAQVEIISSYVENINSLYNACDILFSMSHSECFFYPSLEAMLYSKVSVIPRHGGQLDFCNDENSILIDGKLGRAPLSAQYWSGHIGNCWFEPGINDAAEKLRYAALNYKELQEKFRPKMEQTVQEFSWKNAVNKIMELVK